MSNLDINKEDFNTLLTTETKPILVDFWAPWCGPCRAIAPTIETFSTENTDFKVVKINVDEEAEISMQYNIQSIPSLLVFVDGCVAKRKSGSISKKGLEEFLEEFSPKQNED